LSEVGEEEVESRMEAAAFEVRRLVIAVDGD